MQNVAAEHSEHQAHHTPQSPWPPIAALGFFALAWGLVYSFSSFSTGMTVVGVGGAVTAFSAIMWWKTVSSEFLRAKQDPDAVPHEHASSVLVPGILFFIASEVMFFGAFFAFYFYTRARLGHYLPTSWAQGDTTALTPGTWWGSMKGGVPSFIQELRQPMAGLTWGNILKRIPAFNTAELVLSSVTFTVAHHYLNHGNRKLLKVWLAVTIALGAMFLVGQFHEYSTSGITLASGLMGSAFFILTGFHGLHVTIGVIWLAVMLLRVSMGHFDRENQFAFRAAGWYWHFVDVVWLCLFSVLYLWT